MKKLLALLLATLILGFSASTVASGDWLAPPAFSDIAGHEAEGDLTLLAALGVMTGDEGLGGPVRPDDPITRAEFCKLVVLAFGRGSMAEALMGLRPDFVDEIPAWAWGYVNVASYMGVVNGYEDGTFRPSGNLSYAEALTMLVRAVPQHNLQVEAGVWPYNYLFYGVDAGFNGDVDVSFAALPCSRGDMARLLAATLQVHEVSATGAPVADSAILTDRAWADESLETHHVGRLYQGLAITFGAWGETPGWEGYDGIPIVVVYPELNAGFTLTLSDLVYVVGADNLDALNGLYVRAVTNADDEVIFIEVTTGVGGLVTGVFKELADTDSDSTNDTIILADGTKVPLPAPSTGHASLMLNRVRQTNLNEIEAFEVGSPKLDDYLPPELAIIVDEAGAARSVLATAFSRTLWIETFTASETLADGTPVDTYVGPYNDDGFDVSGDCLVTINGSPAGRDDLAEHDAISVAFVGAPDDAVIKALVADDYYDPYIIRANRVVVEGTVDSTATHYPGTVHEATIELADGSVQTYSVNESGGIGSVYALPSSGATVRYGLDFDGSIFVPIGYEGITPWVLVKSFVVSGDGSGTATVDIRGSEVTYKVADLGIDTAADLDTDPDLFLHDLFVGYATSGELIWIEVDTATGTIVDVYNPVGAGSGPWYVLANSAGALTLADDPVSPTTYDFIAATEAITVYMWDDTFTTLTYAAVDTLPLTDGDSCMVGNPAGNSYGFDGTPDLVPGDACFMWGSAGP